jgi:hypothetical protein
VPQAKNNGPYAQLMRSWRNKKPRGARRDAALEDVCSPGKAKKYEPGQPRTLVDITFSRRTNYHVPSSQYAAPAQGHPR